MANILQMTPSNLFTCGKILVFYWLKSVSGVYSNEANMGSVNGLFTNATNNGLNQILFADAYLHHLDSLS